jgi:hypothetical protein
MFRQNPGKEVKVYRSKTKQNKTKQNKTKQNKTKQNKTKQKTQDTRHKTQDNYNLFLPGTMISLKSKL